MIMTNKFCAAMFIVAILSINSANADLAPYEIRNLNRAEAMVLGQNNYNAPLETRLAMTEQQLFGSIQSGSLNDRISIINQVLNNSQKQQIQNYRMKNRLMNAVRNLTTGYMTGFTPPVYNNYSNYSNYPNYPSNRRYYNTSQIPQPIYDHGNKNFITQTRVIIDD